MRVKIFFSCLLLCLAYANTHAQQPITISGSVMNQNGEPLQGATVVQMATTNTTVTDQQGLFKLLISSQKGTLTISYIGYITAVIPIQNQKTIHIVLTEATSSLNDVVVVGYGTQKRANLTGAVSTVNSKDLTRAPIASTSNALAGRLPGLISKELSGSPGMDRATLSIRGFDAPLVIVDGVEIPNGLDNIDANEIESISILKDASAAIYGARAGNGVILITTKRGVAGKPTITYNGSYSHQTVTDYPKLMNSGQFAEYDREVKTNMGLTESQQRFSQDQVTKFYNGTDPQYPNTDWYHKLIRPFAPMQQQNLSISGGNDKIRYYGFFGYLDQKTFWKYNGGDFQRFNIRSNIDAKITDNLSMQLDFSNINQLRDNFAARDYSGSDASLWRDFWVSQPIYPYSLPDPTKYSFGGSSTGSPLISTNSKISGFNNNDIQDIKTGASLKYNVPFIKGLSAKIYLNYWQEYNNTKVMNKPASYYTYDYTSKTYTLVGTWSPEASIQQQDNKSRNITNQFSLSYDRVIAKNHKISLLGLYESIDYSSDYIQAQRFHFLTPNIEYLFGGSSTDQYANGSATEMGRKSYVGRLDYSFKNKYLLDATLRADASAKFPLAKRWGYFPSVSAGWKISEENFMKGKFKWLESLKIRGGEGNSGYDNVGNFAYVSGYNFGGNYIFGTSVVNGLTSSGLANPNLTWEKISTSNVGLDFSLNREIVYGSIDVFYRKLTGIPATRILSLPTTFGASLPPENLNSQDARGFEIKVGTKGTRGNFSWDVTGNVSWSRSKWIHYEEPDYSSDPKNLARVYQISGTWTDRIMGYKADGLYTSQQEINAMKFDQDRHANTTIKPGDVKYVDVNKDSILDWKDMVDIGKGNVPHWMGGLSIYLGYKNIDFSVLFQGAAGAYVPIGLAGTEEEFINRWSPTNNKANGIYARPGSQAQGGGFSNFSLRNADYVRLKTLSIGYSLPKQLLNLAKINNLRVFVAGTNLLTLDKLKKFGFDPEIANNVSGNPIFYYPQQRTITLGVNLTL